MDSIDGLSPAISIEQKTTNRSPRSTVGTITEIYDYLRVLYSSIGVPHCPNCGIEISRQSTEQILQQILALPEGERIMILAPIVRGRKGEYKKDLEKLSRQGFVRARIDGMLRSLDEKIPLDRRRNHTIEVVVDRLPLKPGSEKRLEASIETAAKLANGLVIVAVVNGEEKLYSQKLACPNCGASVPQLEPRSFSFNSPFGACENLQRPGQHLELRSRQGHRRFVQAAARRRTRPGRQLVLHAPAARTRRPARLQDQARETVRRSAQAHANAAARRRQRLQRHRRAFWTRPSRTPAPAIANGSWTTCRRRICPACNGRRLKPSSLAVRVKGVGLGGAHRDVHRARAGQPSKPGS